MRLASGSPQNSAGYAEAKGRSHPQPSHPKDAHSSANPERVYTGWLRESWDYVRFVNPGDLRVAERTCGTSGCHTAEVRKVQTSMMTHGAMLWPVTIAQFAAFLGIAYVVFTKRQRHKTALA